MGVDLGGTATSFRSRSLGDELHTAHLVRWSQAAGSPALPVDVRVEDRPAVTNLYLLTGAHRSLLLDTGTVGHQDQVLHWLGANLPTTSALDAVVLRMGEFDSVANMLAIADTFPISTIHGAQVDGLDWFDVHAEPADPNALGAAVYSRLTSADSIALAPNRELEAVQPLLRLLTTHWLYDPLTHTVFTSDAFSHVTEPPTWLVTSESDTTTLDDVCGHLVSGRFWWLAGARTAPIIDWLTNFFAERRVDRVCPAHGAVIEGADLVRWHVELMIDALLRLADQPARYPFGTWRWGR